MSSKGAMAAALAIGIGALGALFLSSPKPTMSQGVKDQRNAILIALNTATVNGDAAERARLLDVAQATGLFSANEITLLRKG